MDDKQEETDSDVWTSLLVGLAAAWAERTPGNDQAIIDDGERYLAAARAVARNT